MKTLKFLILTLLLTFVASNIGCRSTTISSRSSRTVVKAKRIPPGQAKKIRGDKSARRYAPGQNK